MQDLHAAADNRTRARSAANRFATRREDAYPRAVACLRDDLLTCFHFQDPDQRRQVSTLLSDGRSDHAALWAFSRTAPRWTAS